MLVKCIINCKGIAIRALIKIGSADLINYRSRADWCCCVLGYFFKSGIRVNCYLEGYPKIKMQYRLKSL